MAGIGFELKKVFDRTGFFAKARGSSYAGAVSAGPMLLGMGMIILVRLQAGQAGLDRNDAMLISGMVTVSLIASMLVSSLISLTVSRFASDQLYQNHPETLLSSFYGSSALGLLIGSVPFSLIMLYLKLSPFNFCAFLTLFFELILVWNEMNYLTIVRSYRGILRAFLTALVGAVLSSFVLCHVLPSAQQAMLLSILIGFTIILLLQYLVMKREFPIGSGSPFAFLKWYRDYPLLPVTGLLMNLGLYAPIVLIWFSPIRVHISGNLYAAPDYDVAAMFSFLTVLPAMIGFITYVETEFYPHYHRFFYYLSHGGSLLELEHAQETMLMVLKNGVYQLGIVQLGVTVLSVALLPKLLSWLPIGFTEQVAQYYRLLCVAYGAYILSNILYLFLLYFADYRGALFTSTIFATSSVVATLFVLHLGERSLYGAGFFVSAMVFFIAVCARMEHFFPRLPYYLLSRQPVSSGKESK